MANKEPKKAIQRYDIGNPSKMTSMAVVLKQHVVKNKLYTTIADRNYAHVEGWQFAGGLLGLFPKVVSVENLSTGQELKWKAEVEIISLKNGEVISRGFAICSNKENKKKSFDEYAVLSMAQTRAIGKAYRNLLGWVMKLAGYEGTPSEEMQKVGQEVGQSGTSQPKTASKPEPILCHGAITKAGCPIAAVITEQERDYSKRIYGKTLCRNCQKEAKPKK